MAERASSGDMWSLHGVPWPGVMEPGWCWSDGAGWCWCLYQAGCWWPPSSLPSPGGITVRMTLTITPHRGTAVRRNWCSEVQGLPTELGQWESPAGHRSLFQLTRSRMFSGFAEDRRTHRRGGRGLHLGPFLGFMWYQDCELQRGLWPLGHHVLLTVTVSRKTQPLGLAFSQSPAVAGESGQWLTATQWHPRTILGPSPGRRPVASGAQFGANISSKSGSESGLPGRNFQS